MEKLNIYTGFFDTLSYLGYQDLKLEIKQELEKAIATGAGKDGTALDMVLGACFANGELFTDGECLDMVGHIIKVWNQIGDEEEAS